MASVQEQITQSAQTGIYPAITPDVRVLDVPGKPNDRGGENTGEH